MISFQEFLDLDPEDLVRQYVEHLNIIMHTGKDTWRHKESQKIANELGPLVAAKLAYRTDPVMYDHFQTFLGMPDRHLKQGKLWDQAGAILSEKAKRL